jgi:hypothetical protein
VLEQPAFWGLRDGTQPPNLSIPKTVDEVIIHHADRLHVCIDEEQRLVGSSTGDQFPYG